MNTLQHGKHYIDRKGVIHKITKKGGVFNPDYPFEDEKHMGFTKTGGFLINGTKCDFDLIKEAEGEENESCTLC